MSVTDNGGFQKEQTEYMKRKAAFQQLIVKDVEDVSVAIMWRIKRIMPVDTGRARATWGIFTAELLVKSSIATNGKGKVIGMGENPPNPNESVWKVYDKGMRIKQGANLKPHNYIEELNAGSSTQAPALFLDVAEQVAADELMKKIYTHTGQL